MVQLIQIITANAAAFFLLLIVKLHMNTQMEGRGLLDTKILRVMINLTMFQCVWDSLVFWVDGQTFAGARMLNIIGNVIYYILNGTIAYFWPLFTEYKLTSNYKKVTKLAGILAIPLIISSILIATSPFTGIIFTVSEDNVYARSEVFFAIPTILIFAYVIYGTVNVYLKRKKAGQYMLFPAIYFVTPIMLAMITQMMYYGISLIFIGIAIGITGVYISTQSESVYIDHLCGVYNRRYYNDYILSFCNANKKDEVITGVLIDMDEFKVINDTFGHHSGDNALIIFSSVLRKYMNSIGFAVRYGGDEFILITKKGKNAAKEAVEQIVKEIKEINDSGANEFQLKFSYGVATLDVNGEAETFLREMDKNMYEMKNARKM